MLRTRAKTYLEFALLAVILVFVAALTGGFFFELFFAGDAQASHAFYGGLVGALYAFFFVRLGEFLTRLFERSQRNAAALLSLQRRFIEAVNALTDNRQAFGFWGELIDRPPGTIWANRLHRVELDDSQFHDLTNIDLLNELLLLRVKMHRLSDDLETFNRAYDQMTALFLDGRMPPADYHDGLKGMNERQKLLSRFCIARENDLKRAHATVRVLIRNRTLGERLMAKMARQRYPRDFDAERDRELAKVMHEAEEMTSKNRQDIAKTVESIDRDDGKSPSH